MAAPIAGTCSQVPLSPPPPTSRICASNARCLCFKPSNALSIDRLELVFRRCDAAPLLERNAGAGIRETSLACQHLISDETSNASLVSANVVELQSSGQIEASFVRRGPRELQTIDVFPMLCDGLQ